MSDSLDRVKGFFGEAETHGRYEILREIGRGGMATVYEAFDPQLRRAVALKVIREGGLDRLRREAEAAARLRHPNIVTIHEVGPDYLAMDLVPGRRLSEAPDRIRALETVARAVAYAHSQGVVHRDLKPSNVLVEPGGRVVLVDFGLARIEGEDLTRTGATAGTPAYMAPEQARGERVGPAADVWSLGVMLYEIAAGRRPFEGGTALAVYERIAKEEPAALPGDLGAIAAKALEKDPGRRYADAGAFADDLRRHLEGTPVSARPVGAAGRAWRKARRNPAPALAAMVAVLLAAAVFYAVSQRGRALAALRRQAQISLDAALALRRAGSNAAMRAFLPPLEEAYRQTPASAEAEHLMGRMWRALLEDDRALEHQTRALELNPGYRPALYERALLFSMAHGRGLTEETWQTVGASEAAKPALALLRDAALRDARAHGPDPLIDGIRAYHEGRYVEARKVLEGVESEEGREALARVIRAELLPVMEDRERAWKRAEDLLTQGIERDRGYLPHWIDRGNLRWSRGSWRRHRGHDPMPDYLASEEDYSQAIGIDPQSREAWTWRGRVRVYHAIWAIENGRDPAADIAKAVADLTRAIEIDKGYPLAWLWRGNARFYLGLAELEGLHRWEGAFIGTTLDKAEKDLTEALKLAATSENHRWRGRMRALWSREVAPLYGEAVYEEAAADFEAALPGGREDSWYWTWRSTVPSERGLYQARNGRDPLPDFAEAEANLNEAIRLQAHHMEAWKHRGFVRWHRAEHLERKGDAAGARAAYAAAAADFFEALSINPTLRHQIGDRLDRARGKSQE